MELKKFSEELEDKLIDDENYKLAHKYMDLYLDGLIEEHKTRRENDYLLQKLDQMIDAMREMQGEIAQIKEQNSALAEGIQYLDFSRLTIGIGGRGQLSGQDDEVNAILQSLQKARGPVGALNQAEPASDNSNSPFMPQWEKEEAQPPFHPPDSIGQIGSSPAYRATEAAKAEDEESEKEKNSLYRLSENEDFREMFSPDNRNPFAPGYEDKNNPLPAVPAVPAIQSAPRPVTPAAPPAQAKPAPEEQPQKKARPPVGIISDSEKPRQKKTAKSASAAHQSPPKTEKEKKKGFFTILSNILFYISMAVLLIGSVAFAQSTSAEKSLFGFRYYYIRTSSMTPVYPVGSIVITKVTDPQDIQVGDDITIYVGNGASDTYLTHRVVEITEDQTGELAFRTKGVNNKSNDPSPFNAKMMVGKVVFCIPMLGTVMTFVRSQLLLVVGIFILLLALSFMLRLLLTGDSDEEKQPKPHKAVSQKNKSSKKQDISYDADNQNDEDSQREA